MPDTIRRFTVVKTDHDEAVTAASVARAQAAARAEREAICRATGLVIAEDGRIDLRPREAKGRWQAR